VRRWILSGLCVMFLLNCEFKEESIEGRIDGWYAENYRKSKVCTLSISKDVFNTDWDRMCVFRYGASLKEVNDVLRVDFSSKYREFTRKIVFMKGTQIVYWEQHESDVEKPLQGEVAFESNYSANHVVYTRTEAVFNIEKVYLGGLYYYVLFRDK
jgi:hypothetical protein